MNPLCNLVAITTITILTESCLADDWQLRRLNNPSPTEITIEQNGKIFIYDALEEPLVDKALDDNFSRIENMMFIRTKYLVSDMEDLPDDGCD